MDENGTARMVLFSDAVIAITITLMVLEIRLPVSAEALSDAQLWQVLTGMLPQFFAYGLSFVVIAAFWLGHRTRFADISRSDGVLVWLNMAFLLAIGLMPFLTSLLADNSGSLATALYAGLIALIALILFAIGIYADARGLSDAGAYRQRPAWTGLVGAAVFLISIPIAFADADLAKYFWIVLFPIEFIVNRRWPRAAKG